MATLTLSAQTSDNDFILTQKDFGLAAISKDIKSTSINGQTYYYTIVKDKPNLVVIVAKKKAYTLYKEVVLPETFISADGQELTIVGIGDKAFEKCSSIKKVDLPKTVRYIGNEAFCNADVDDLSLKEGLIKIGNKAFLNNDLKDIHIPDGVEEIGELALMLGAGVETLDDKIDYGVGIELKHVVGDRVKKGDLLVTLYVNSNVKIKNIKEIFKIN